MKLFFILISFLILNCFLVVADPLISTPLDCYPTDLPEYDPLNVCAGKVIDNCETDATISHCAVCVFPGAIETCTDGIDNNCNVNESLILDGDMKSGSDSTDITCCGFLELEWRDYNDQVITTANFRDNVYAVVVGSPACNESVQMNISVYEEDFLSNQYIGSYLINLEPSLIGRAVVRVVDMDPFDESEYFFNATVVVNNVELYSSHNSYRLIVGSSTNAKDLTWNQSCGFEDVNSVFESYVGMQVKSTNTFKGLSFYFNITNLEDGGHIDTTYVDGSNNDVLVTNRDAFESWNVEYSDEVAYAGSGDELEYEFTAYNASHDIVERSDGLRVYECDGNIDSDCDRYCDIGTVDPSGVLCLGYDMCPTSSDYCEVDENGCSGFEATCLSGWDCSDTTWTDCDANGIKRRSICVDGSYDPNCCDNQITCACTIPDPNLFPGCDDPGAPKPPTEMMCDNFKPFPGFSNLNVVFVVLSLVLFYSFSRKSFIK